MRVGIADRIELRKILFTGGNASGLPDPVLAEDSLPRAGDRPFHAHVRVAPMLAVLRAPGPLLGNPMSADVPDTAIEHRDLSMRTVVHPADIADAQRMKQMRFTAGLAQRFDHFVTMFGARG